MHVERAPTVHDVRTQSNQREAGEDEEHTKDEEADLRCHPCRRGHRGLVHAKNLMVDDTFGQIEHPQPMRSNPTWLRQGGADRARTRPAAICEVEKGIAER